MTEEKDIACTGTARATHEMSEYEMLELDYNEGVALSVTTKAFQHRFPEITCDDIKSTVKVIRAARSGKVNVAAERQRMEEHSQKAVLQIMQCISEKEEVE